MTEQSASRVMTAIGLMTGTSMDGIDAALIRTDGRSFVETGATMTIEYDASFSRDLRRLLGPNGRKVDGFATLEAELTRRHADLVKSLLTSAGIRSSEVDLIGFHGQTIFHDPKNGVTDQIGDGALLAVSTGIDTVSDFRSNDVHAGGEGAPFAPLYHAALGSDLVKPIAVLNLGGVGNVTYLGMNDEILAFDTGPASALIDDWCRRKTAHSFDRDGQLAASGQIAHDLVDQWLENPYFQAKPPKSLDRNSFDVSGGDMLSDADGAATLMAFTVASVARARDHLPSSPHHWYVTGGGRRNIAMMAALRSALGVPVEPVEAVGWDGDALEAQAFAYLAVRSVEGLALSVPTTTGVAEPMPGGRLFRAKD